MENDNHGWSNQAVVVGTGAAGFEITGSYPPTWNAYIHNAICCSNRHLLYATPQ